MATGPGLILPANSVIGSIRINVVILIRRVPRGLKSSVFERGYSSLGDFFDTFRSGLRIPREIR